MIPSKSLSEASANETVTKKPDDNSSSSENASVEGSSDTLPPFEFPLDDDKTLPKNDTALRILQSVSSQSKSIEVIASSLM